VTRFGIRACIRGFSCCLEPTAKGLSGPSCRPRSEAELALYKAVGLATSAESPSPRQLRVETVERSPRGTSHETERRSRLPGALWHWTEAPLSHRISNVRAAAPHFRHRLDPEERKASMAPISYQTITLSKGKHASPEDGACAMELAAMLAGEPFNDHTPSVCPVIGSFLRAYNDEIDDRRRQDLYPYAAKVVGSRASLDVQHARAERLSAWAFEGHWLQWLHRLVPARLRALIPTPPAELVGSHAVCAIAQHNDNTHTEVLALIDELLTIGAHKPPTTRFEHDDAQAGLCQSPTVTAALTR